METKVKKTLNGNYVIEQDGVLMFAKQDGNFLPAETGTLHGIPVRSVMVEYQTLSEIPSNYETIVEKNAENYRNAVQAFEESQEVCRMDIEGQKIQLRSNGRLYGYSLGWNREPLNEHTRNAVKARLVHNKPFDESLYDEEYIQKVNKVREEVQQQFDRETKWEQEVIDKFNSLQEPIVPNVENIRAVLMYLSLQNWGGWDLPKFTVGYSAHQYDCDGKTAVTMTFDEPITDKKEGIEKETKFVIGAPKGHLQKYQRI